MHTLINNVNRTHNTMNYVGYVAPVVETDIDDIIDDGTGETQLLIMLLKHQLLFQEKYPGRN